MVVVVVGQIIHISANRMHPTTNQHNTQKKTSTEQKLKLHAHALERAARARASPKRAQHTETGWVNINESVSSYTEHQRAPKKTHSCHNMLGAVVFFWVGHCRDCVFPPRAVLFCSSRLRAHGTRLMIISLTDKTSGRSAHVSRTRARAHSRLCIFRARPRRHTRTQFEQRCHTHTRVRARASLAQKQAAEQFIYYVPIAHAGRAEKKNRKQNRHTVARVRKRPSIKTPAEHRTYS